VLVAFVDSDCVLAADWLRALVAPFEDPCVGAVSGLVEDTCRDNAWERMFAGTHRLPRRGPVGRIVIGNLCGRREILAAHLLDESRPTRRDAGGTRPDLSISARSDEEGLNIALRDAGWKVLAEPSARAEHVRVSVTSLCIASGVPPTTALRWIGRARDDADAVRRARRVAVRHREAAPRADYR
jgi:hypothetical protein